MLRGWPIGITKFREKEASIVPHGPARGGGSLVSRKEAREVNGGDTDLLKTTRLTASIKQGTHGKKSLETTQCIILEKTIFT